jgi:hypothetical protein
MKKYPWRELKEAEILITDHLASRTPTPSDLVEKLRRSLSECATAPDADCAICFHGATACLAQIDGDIGLAINCREIERQKISLLYEEEEKSPTDGFSLQNYLDEDISKRESIKRLLREKEAEQNKFCVRGIPHC